MRSKFSIMLVCCVLALTLLVPSILLGVQLSLPNLGKLLESPKILSFSSIGELKLLLQQQEEGQEQAYPETYMFTQGVAAAKADISTGHVWAVVMRDSIEGGGGTVQVGFKTNGLQNTGSTPLRGVTVTVTANILVVQQPSNDVYLHVSTYKDGSFIETKEQYIGGLGNYNVTSSSFTMEPGHNYYAVGFFFCRSSVENQATILVAEITDINWNI